MADIYSWSTTAADNDDADATINWAEGQDPSTVNDSARAMMKRVAELLDDLGGVGTVGGTGNAITVTSAIDSLANGKLVAFKAGSANSGATTLNVNSLGAKAIRKNGDVALGGGEIAANGIYICRYDAAYNSAAGAWVLLSPEFIVSPDDVEALGSAGGTRTVDMAGRGSHVASLAVSTSANTLAITNPPASGSEGVVTLYITNGGSQTFNWPSGTVWPGGIVPVLTTSGVDIITLSTIDAGTTWYGGVVGLGMT